MRTRALPSQGRGSAPEVRAAIWRSSLNPTCSSDWPLFNRSIVPPWLGSSPTRLSR